MAARRGADLKTLALLALIAALVLPRIWILERDPPARIAPHGVRDEGFYTRNLRCLVATGRPARDHWLVASSSLSHSLVLAAVARLDGAIRLRSVRAVSAVAVLLVAALLGRFLWRERSAGSSLAFLALLACDPLLLVSSGHATPYTVALLALAAAFVLGARGRPGPWTLVAAGFLAGVAAVTKTQSQALLALLLETWWSDPGPAAPSRARRAVLLLGGAAAPLLGFAVLAASLPDAAGILAREGFLQHFALPRGLPVLDVLVVLAPAVLLALPSIVALLRVPPDPSPAARLDRLMLCAGGINLVLTLPLAWHFPRYDLPLATAVAWLSARTLCLERPRGPAGRIARVVLPACSLALAATRFAGWYLPGTTTARDAVGLLRDRFVPGEAVFVGQADVLLMEAPVCPVSARSTARLEADAEGLVLLDARGGVELVRARHALLLPGELARLDARVPGLAGHLELVEWIGTSWDGDVALLRWRTDGPTR